ncbi:helix-turn-helix domain-containing protein [Salsuginibacillus kocurii]|uniref:helix-turn-helix domain-containing protein n=1 Tax=Salsuginibacillus kocurii TaxID=427078 RepID=UPI0003682DB9|nr:helix-turn-helix transcriptional regulator [Salsuginibacillus kocurii]
MLGDQIRYYREKQEISLNTLAKKAGISKSYLSYMERNVKQNPSIELLSNIAAALNVSINDLVGK